MRGGKHVTLEVENLVVGDVVNVGFGDRVPADIRIIDSVGFKVSVNSWYGIFVCLCFQLTQVMRVL